MSRFALLLASLALFGCGPAPAKPKPPGDEVMGTYAFESKGIFSACGLTAPGNFTFEGTFSRFRDGGRAFFLTDRLYDAGFDGQRVTFGSNDPGGGSLRDGGSCSPCTMRTIQAGTIALLSPSQSAAVGEVCPTNVLDGGLPGADDAGISLPQGTEDGGFDAVRACGELEVNVVGEGLFCDPACYSCTLRYRWTGARKT